ALESHSNVQDHQGQVYGEYWYDHNSMTFEERQKHGITARIDFLSGHDLKLYYRYWNREQVVFARECPTDGSQEDAVDAFKMPIAQLKLYVTQYVPSETPRVIPVKQEFVKDRLIGDPMMGGRMPAAKFKLTMDDKSEEFWLFPHLATPESAPTSRPNSPKRIEIMEGKAGRVAALTMPIKAIDIGFRVRLAKFERKLDPGTDQPSHYASWVDFVDQTADRAIYSLASSKASARSYIMPELKQPTSLAYDAKRDDLYWIDARAKEIRRAKWSDIQQDAKSAKVETVVAQGLRKPTALVVDSEHELLFWADTLASGRDEIGVIRSATTTGDKLATIAEVRHTPQAIALDSDAKVLYFASRGQNSIGRASYDGEETDVTWYPSATRPTGLALHAAKQQLYWCELGKNAIFRLDVGNPGNKPLTISRKTGVEPIALAIDGKNERLAFFETLPKPAVTADGLPTSKPHFWQLTSVQFDGDDERVDSDETIDEPQSLVFDKAGHALWTQTATTRTDVWITMNAPVDCYDPTTGRSYRLFQERFAGPFKPGQQITERMSFEDLVPPDSQKRELYESILTVNYDPGRGIRNVGCLLICLGIGTMFYMRAYFFKAKTRVAIKPVAAQMV
ncbi:MAG TPA: hypothetical protein VL096_06870, partial [Pirellulaceae bacterium]|nr:hypothetical protein [Pirellulaceae bacterium]